MYSAVRSAGHYYPEVLIEQNPMEGDRKQNDYRKLQQMVDYCYTTRCLRSAQLDYFGEVHEDKPCGICSSCTDDRELVDMTIDAQKIFSCIHRMRERYGVSGGVGAQGLACQESTGVRLRFLADLWRHGKSHGT